MPSILSFFPGLAHSLSRMPGEGETGQQREHHQAAAEQTDSRPASQGPD
jgi:hypothetical protein